MAIALWSPTGSYTATQRMGACPRDGTIYVGAAGEVGTCVLCGATVTIPADPTPASSGGALVDDKTAVTLAGSVTSMAQLGPTIVPSLLPAGTSVRLRTYGDITRSAVSTGWQLNLQVGPYVIFGGSLATAATTPHGFFFDALVTVLSTTAVRCDALLRYYTPAALGTSAANTNPSFQIVESTVSTGDLTTFGASLTLWFAFNVANVGNAITRHRVIVTSY